MTNKDLQKLLQEYPGDITIKIMVDHNSQVVHDFNDDHIMHTSTTAYIDDDAPEDEWDHEDGKFELGDGQRYLLLNPVII